MSKLSNAELGRRAAQAIKQSTDNKYGYAYYVNKTPKYISVKIETDHLTMEQLEQVTSKLKKMVGDRFLKVYNSTARPSNPYPATGTYKAEKVNVRFTQ
jgi:uncharacterized protein YlbG (UPF0298 family)